MSEQFLEEVSQEIDVKTLSELTTTLSSVRQQIQQKELELAALAQQEKKLSKELLPQFLFKYGISEIKLVSGNTLSIKKSLFARIPKEPAKRREALDWLKKVGGGDLIKDTLTIDEPTEALVKIVEEQGLFFSQDRDVNTNSLLAFLRELLGLKKGSIAKANLADIPPSLGVYLDYSTEIKE